MDLKKELSSVAEAVKKIMDEELKGQQHKIDVNKNNKVDSQDLAMLRSGKKVAKEEVEQIDELKTSTLQNYQIKASDSYKKAAVRAKNAPLIADPDSPEEKQQAAKEVQKQKQVMAKRKAGYVKAGAAIKARGEKSAMAEEVEQIEESAADKAKEILAKKREERMEKMDFSKEKSKASNVRKVEGKYGKEEMKDDDDDTMKSSKKGTFKRRYNTKVYKEEFTALIECYKTEGIKGLFENLEVIEEEPDNEQFTKELEDQKATAAGKKAPAKVADAGEKAVVVQKEEVEQVEERTLTEPEMKKREEVVKSMKKNIQGFKQRYGGRAKEVMYATATKVAKEAK